MRRISIVFQETDDKPGGQGQGYVVFMDGHDSARMKLPDDQLSAVEFVARACLAVVIGTLSKAGSIVSVKKPTPV